MHYKKFKKIKEEVMKKLLHSEDYNNGFKNVDEMITRLKELREGFVISLRSHEIDYKKSKCEEDKEYHGNRIDHFTELIDAYTEKIDSLERTVQVRVLDIALITEVISKYKDYVLDLDEYDTLFMQQIDKLDDKLCEIIYK